MNIAISLSDELFARADALARILELSRGELYRRALEEYLARNVPDHVTRALDELCTELGTDVDPFVSESSRRILEGEEW